MTNPSNQTKMDNRGNEDKNKELRNEAIDRLQNFLMINFFNLTGMEPEKFHGDLKVKLEHGRIERIYATEIIKRS